VISEGDITAIVELNEDLQRPLVDVLGLSEAALRLRHLAQLVKNACTQPAGHSRFKPFKPIENGKRPLIARPGAVELAQLQLMLGDVVDDTNELDSALAGQGFKRQLLELVQHQLSQLATTLVVLQVIKMVGKHARRLEYQACWSSAKRSAVPRLAYSCSTISGTSRRSSGFFDC
jgi:hypothetical protein